MGEFDEQLISKVQKYLCLFNTRSSDLKVSLKKKNAWIAIGSTSGKKFRTIARLILNKFNRYGSKKVEYTERKIYQRT